MLIHPRTFLAHSQSLLSYKIKTRLGPYQFLPEITLLFEFYFVQFSNWTQPFFEATLLLLDFGPCTPFIFL